MHPRIGRAHIAHCIWMAALVCAAGCSTAPPSRTETPAILELREDYLRNFPDGPHNDNIRRGEVVKGMNFFEVLASWGYPDARMVSQDNGKERWVYVLFDDLSLNWVCYEYEFRNNSLLDWETTTNVSNGLSLDTHGDRQVPVVLPSWSSSTELSGRPAK